MHNSVLAVYVAQDTITIKPDIGTYLMKRVKAWNILADAGAGRAVTYSFPGETETEARLAFNSWQHRQRRHEYEPPRFVSIELDPSKEFVDLGPCPNVNTVGD